MMMMNAETTLQPTAKYSTHLLFLFFSTPLLFLLFSMIPLPITAFVCAHSFALPFPLLLFEVFQWHFMHSYCFELHKFETCTTSNNKRKLFSIITSFFCP